MQIVTEKNMPERINSRIKVIYDSKEVLHVPFVPEIMFIFGVIDNSIFSNFRYLLIYNFLTKVISSCAYNHPYYPKYNMKSVE